MKTLSTKSTVQQLIFLSLSELPTVHAQLNTALFNYTFTLVQNVSKLKKTAILIT